MQGEVGDLDTLGDRVVLTLSGAHWLLDLQTHTSRKLPEAKGLLWDRIYEARWADPDTLLFCRFFLYTTITAYDLRTGRETALVRHGGPCPIYRCVTTTPDIAARQKDKDVSKDVGWQWR
jgi:hypothetical protein